MKQKWATSLQTKIGIEAQSKLDFFDYFYFSISTYTIAGFDNITPMCVQKILVALESSLGIIMVIFSGLIFEDWITERSP